MEVILKDIASDFGRLLRNFIPAVVGIAYCFIVDEGHNILGEIKTDSGDSWLPLFLCVLAMGVTLFVVHKTIIHSFSMCAIYGLVLEEVNKPDIQTGKEKRARWSVRLDLSRWCRRYGTEGTKATKVQSGLNELNSGCHFLYCSSYAIMLFPIILKYAYPYENGFQIEHTWYLTPLIASLMWCSGFYADIVSTEWDARAMVAFRTGEDATLDVRNEGSKRREWVWGWGVALVWAVATSTFILIWRFAVRA